MSEHCLRKISATSTTDPRRMLLPMLVAAVLSACAVESPPRSIQGLEAPEMEALNRLRETVAAESAKLLANQDEIQRQMRRAQPTPQLQLTEPKFDPLEGKFITMAMSKATISQVLVTLADRARINLVVDPAVIRVGSLSDMYLRDMSLREAFNEILRTYDVGGEIRGNTLRVTLNEERVVSLDFLNSTSQLDMSSGGNVFGSSATGTNPLRGNLSMTGSGGIKLEPYAEIENAIKEILGTNQRRSQGNSTVPAQALFGPPAGINPSQVTSPVPTTSTLDLEEGEKTDAVFSINKMTGTLYVKARPSKIKAVEKMLARAQGMLRKQVHIEAQLVDVQLSDNFEFGVDWSLLRGKLAGGFSPTPATLSAATGVLGGIPGAILSGRSITIPSQTIGSPNGQSLGMGYQTGTVGVVLNALRSFGNLRVLSNPNVQVRNGTPAFLSVGTSSRYVARSSSSQMTPGGGATTVTSDVQTDSVFSGVMVGVLPFMRDDGRIELLINPMQSDVDPKSLQLVSVNDTNRVTLPVVSYKGLTTTLNVGDGDVVVVGGLIDQRTSNNDRGAPGLSDAPVFGKLFGNTANTHNSRELVVVLRVRVL